MKPLFPLLTIMCLCFLLTPDVEAQQSKTQRVSQHKTDQERPQRSPSRPLVEYLSAERPRPSPFSDAVRVGHMLYLSGQIGVDADQKVVPGGIKAETRQVMERIRRFLEKNGSSFNHVVKCTVMMADMSEWGAMNEVYVTYFPKGRLPARSAFGTNGLALGARVEIECLAVVE
ncbi:MAG: RidA family protein [Pyrinomonadaceae bacterium]